MLLAPHLTLENHEALLDAARYKTKREVEYLVATLRPQPEVPSAIRRLPAPRPMATRPVPEGPAVGCATPSATAPSPTPVRPAIVAPVAPERYKVQFTISRETYDKLRQAQDLLRHVIPTGDPAAIFDRALSLLLAEAQRTKFAATTRPRASQSAGPRSRRVPASVRREVWRRDGGRCAFVGVNGRCTERGFLEFHHVVPYADGGAATAGNLELRCRAHNAYEAERWSDGTDTLFVKERRAGFWSTRSGPSAAR